MGGADPGAEILGSLEELEDLLHRAVRSVSYPYGSHDAGVLTFLRERTHVELACTTLPGTYQAGADPLAIPRIAVGDWRADDLPRRLRRLVPLSGWRRGAWERP